MNNPLRQQPEDEHRPISRVRETGTETVDDDSNVDLPVLSKKSPPLREAPPPISSVEKVFGHSGKRYDLLSPAHLLRTLPPGYPINTAIDMILNLLENLRPVIEQEQNRLAALNKLQSEKVPALTDIQTELDQALIKQKNSYLKFRHNKTIAIILEKVSARLMDLANSYFQPQPCGSLETAIPLYIERLQNAITGARNEINDKERDFNCYFLRADELVNHYLSELNNIPASTLEKYLANEQIRTQHQRILHFSEDSEIQKTL